MLFDRFSVNDNILSVLCTFNVGYERKFLSRMHDFGKTKLYAIGFYFILRMVLFYILFHIRGHTILSSLGQNATEHKTSISPNSFYTIL